MVKQIEAKIAQLRVSSREQLLATWLKLYGKAAPGGIRRELLIPFLAYKIQENAFGGLSASTASELRRIARNLENSRGSNKLSLPPKIKPGTRLLRKWRGDTHEVFVTESGYEYRGIGYRSLSEIARKVTRTRWSGPAFFGIKNKSVSRSSP